MNIVEAMTQFNKQYIILLSGLSGTGRTKIAQFTSKVFGFKLVDMKDFMVSSEQYDKPENYIAIEGGSAVLNWDDIEKSINWDALNAAVKKETGGVVVVGLGFPSELIKFTPDQHIHLKINKEKLLEDRHKYLEQHPDDPNAKLVGTNIERQILNRVTIPYYILARDKSKIDRFINMNEIDEAEVKKLIFNHIISYTQQWLEKHEPKKIVNYEGDQKAYDDYHHNKKRKNYDFDQTGRDLEQTRPSSSDLSNTSDITNTSDSDAEFLWTVK